MAGPCISRAKFNIYETILRTVALCYNARMGPIYSDHSRLDERSLALHRLVAEKLLADPALLDKARAVAARPLRSPSGSRF